MKGEGTGKKSKEQLEAEKRAILKQRIKPLEIDSMNTTQLAEKARELHTQILRLEGEKYDLEKRFKQLQVEVISHSFIIYNCLSFSVFRMSLFVKTKRTHASTQVQIMTTYEKHLYGVTGRTQKADASLIRATHVLKAYWVEYMYSTIHKKKELPLKKKKKHNSLTVDSFHYFFSFRCRAVDYAGYSSAFSAPETVACQCSICYFEVLCGSQIILLTVYPVAQASSSQAVCETWMYKILPYNIV